MKWFCLISGFAIVSFLQAQSSADSPNEQHKTESTVIPLDQIWAYNIPGTQDIAGIPLPEPKGLGETDASFRKQREQNIEQMRRALTAKPPSERALSGFVLAREPDFYTLKGASTLAASAMLHEKGGFGDNVFRAGSDITLVFYSHPASYYVRLKEIERQGNEITVHYQFEPHSSVESTVHFALIPLGKLPTGEYQVHFKQVRMEQKYHDAGFEPVHPEALEIVCRPFSFTIWEPSSVVDEVPAKGATLIPLNQIWGYEMPGTRDIRELEPKQAPNLSKRDYILGSLVNQIVVWLGKVPQEGEKAGPAFVVAGTGDEALKNAHAVFTAKEREKPEKLPRDTDLSLVFYSYMTGWRAQINSVEQSPGLITVKYQFIAPLGHSETTRFNFIPIGDSATRFALIPIGKFSEGTVQVKIEQLPAVDVKGQPVRPKREPDRYVSGSFSFDVR